MAFAERGTDAYLDLCLTCSPCLNRVQLHSPVALTACCRDARLCLHIALCLSINWAKLNMRIDVDVHIANARLCSQFIFPQCICGCKHRLNFPPHLLARISHARFHLLFTFALRICSAMLCVQMALAVQLTFFFSLRMLLALLWYITGNRSNAHLHSVC
eukprot:CAMPEP_0180422198 /NCGR_PEP_ID=MMETSP1036_2-20121128/3552_1 /TAXON_ID=632150 /ORGANISM="Azadinium spinosum, Strain 3D9" /LENGTH=158 /DNA_ID=CAMNT_0022427505 /DNA_START=857 /DNA_END=1330 /DNA_ORIENTATION=-